MDILFIGILVAVAGIALYRANRKPTPQNTNSSASSGFQTHTDAGDEDERFI